MKSRERILAVVAVVVLIGVFGRSWIARLATPFAEVREKIKDAQTELEGLDAQELRGMALRRELNDLIDRSLPNPPAQARANYQSWLNRLAGEVGIQGQTVIPGSARPTTVRIGREAHEVYEELPFTFSCTARLPQLVRFLHAFYARDLLHKIESCSISPNSNDPRQLAIKIGISALVLPDAEQSLKLPERESDRLALPSVDDYVDSIVNRNIFGPPNAAPQISVADRIEANPGRPKEVELSASDAESHQVRYELLAGPEGAQLDADSGKFTWRPGDGDLGREETVRVAAIDDGVPEQRVEKEFVVAVVEGSAAPPNFDTAQATLITGLVESNNRPTAWISEKPTGKRFEVQEGDELAIGEFRATITSIDLDASFVRFRYDDREYQWPMNETLAAVLEKPADAAALVGEPPASG